jgi:outer membrane protein, heavy metal efflux system
MISWLLLICFSTEALVSEKQVFDHVLEQFPSVRMAQNDLQIAEGEQVAADGAFDILLQGAYTENSGDYENEVLSARLLKPTALFGLDLYAGFKKSDGNLAVYDEEWRTLDRGEWSVGGKLPLLRDFLIDDRRGRVKKANFGREQRNYQLQATELEQVRNALHRYWDWVLAGKRLLIQRGLLQIAEQRDVWLLKRSKAGDIPRFERNDNLRSILQRRSSVMQSEVFLEQAISELGFFIDDSQLKKQLFTPRELTRDTVPLVQTSLTQKSYTELADLALQQRPDLKALQMQIEQNKVDESLASNRFLPKLDLQAQFSRDDGTGSTSLDDDNVKAMVNLELPLQYRAIRGRQAQVRAQTQRLNNQKQLLKQRIEADIQAIKKNLDIALQRRELALEEFALAQNLEKGERTRLNQGETNVLIVNLREQATAEAELRLAETTVEAMKHWISLKVSIGELPQVR